jgi:hypothetical protein
MCVNVQRARHAHLPTWWQEEAHLPAEVVSQILLKRS